MAQFNRGGGAAWQRPFTPKAGAGAGSSAANGNAAKWTLSPTISNYDENGNLTLKLSIFRKEDVPVINQVHPDAFQIVPKTKPGIKFPFYYVVIPKDKINTISSIEDDIKNALKSTQHYTDVSIDKFFSGIEELVSSTPTPEEDEANNRKIAQNWRELMEQLNDPETRKKFLNFQTTALCKSQFSTAALSRNNVSMVLAADPMATFVTSEYSWEKTFNRKVLPNSPFVIINKVESKLPMEILKKDDDVIRAGGWQQLVKLSGGIDKGRAWAARKRAMNDPEYNNFKKSLDFRKEKVYDVRFTELIDPSRANDEKYDVFLKVAGLINNLTGEINEPAKQVLRQDSIDRGEALQDYDAKKIGLEGDEELNAFKDFLIKKCKTVKVNVLETGSIQDTIADAAYAYAYKKAEQYNKLNDQARKEFAATICLGVAATFGIESQKVAQSAHLMDSLKQEDREEITMASFKEFQALTNFSIREAAEDMENGISQEEYLAMVNQEIAKYRNKKKKEVMESFTRNFHSLVERMDNLYKQ